MPKGKTNPGFFLQMAKHVLRNIFNTIHPIGMEFSVAIELHINCSLLLE